jgi:hypothetical protein
VRRPRRAGRSRNGPRIARELVRVDLIQTRAASRRKGRLRRWPAGLASAGEGAQGAAERGHRQWPSGRPAEEETEEGKEKGRAGEKLTRGPRVSEREENGGGCSCWARRAARAREEKQARRALGLGRGEKRREEEARGRRESGRPGPCGKREGKGRAGPG